MHNVTNGYAHRKWVNIRQKKYHEIYKYLQKSIFCTVANDCCGKYALNTTTTSGCRACGMQTDSDWTVLDLEPFT